MKNDGEKLKEKISKVLEKHPEGLTIVELSRILSSHRQTVTKYILVLEAKNVVYRRRIGAVTLHYMKKDWERLRK